MGVLETLSKAVDFGQLANLSTVQRVLALAELAAKTVGELNRNMDEAKDVLSADDMAKLRPLMEQIVPRAIETGRKLDEKLEQAKQR